jgi:hypothetical protein
MAPMLLIQKRSQASDRKLMNSSGRTVVYR